MVATGEEIHTTSQVSQAIQTFEYDGPRSQSRLPTIITAVETGRLNSLIPLPPVSKSFANFLLIVQTPELWESLN